MNNNQNLLCYFRDNYLNKQTNLKIINVGNLDEDYSSFFNNPHWNYLVLDDNVGCGSVDIKVNDINCWVELNDGCCEVIISRNFFSSLKYFWLVMFQIERVLKPGGFVCIIVPNFLSNNEISNVLNIFTVNSLESLANYVNLNILEIIEQNSEICLIARKNNIAQDILLNSFEQEAFKSQCDITLEKYQSKLMEFDKINSELYDIFESITSDLGVMNNSNLKYKFESNIYKVKKFNLQLNSTFSEIKHILWNFNCPTHVYCPICHTVHNIFSPVDNLSRLNAQCPNCGSLEEHRLIYLFLSEKTDFLSKPIKLLQFEPEKSLYGYFKKADNIDYISMGISLNDTVDEVINFDGMIFLENSFDVIIYDYLFLNNFSNSEKILNDLYKWIKPKIEGGFLLINLSFLEDEHHSDIINFKNQLEKIGFNVIKYGSEDIINSKLMEIYGIIPNCFFVCEK